MAQPRAVNIFARPGQTGPGGKIFPEYFWPSQNRELSGLYNLTGFFRVFAPPARLCGRGETR